jgi:putative hydrolase of the HAD superfamily
MIKCCIFDMGGVMIRDFHCGPRIREFLGHPGETDFSGGDPRLGELLGRHCRGLIGEGEFWEAYTEITGERIPPHQGSLWGKFFTPRMDGETVELVRALKGRGLRVVCGTNVIDAHFRIHQERGQYSPFDKVYASHLMGVQKPDPAFYTTILSAEGLRPEEAFFTDDLEENAGAAAKLGMEALTYTGADALGVRLRALGLLP